MKKPVEETRKITVNLPASLIDGLVENDDKNLTEIFREALKQYRHRRACNALLALQGKIEFDISYEEMKADRE